MAEKKYKNFDVWIVETSTVYRDVPYTVISDWAQQGRLLADDRVRPSGTEKWRTLGEIPAFAAFLPRAEPNRAEDEAEALEPVQLDFQWHSQRGEADDDVDMIPLIDVSLVLLIFFMMTATVAAIGDINTPEAEHLLLSINPEMYWIGVVPGQTAPDGSPTYTYSLGKGEATTIARFPNQANQAELVNRLTEVLQGEKQPVSIRVRGDHRIPCEVVTEDLRAVLSRLKAQGKLSSFFIEVSEKQKP